MVRTGTGSSAGLPHDWGSSRHSRFIAGIGVEQLSEAGTELAVEDGAADLEQEIGAPAGPPHLLGFVHASVDQEVRGSFGDRRADPQTGTVALGIVDQPSALAGQIAVDLAQRRPQSTRRRILFPIAVALEDRHDLAD